MKKIEIFNKAAIKNALFGKRARYSAFTGLTALVLVAVVIVLNLFVSVYNKSFDLTASKKYSISQQTKDVLKGMTQDVEVYLFQPRGNKDSITDNINELVKLYEAGSSHFKAIYRDPQLYPQLAEQLAGQGTQVQNGSIIVKGPKRTKLIQANDLVTAQMDYQTFQQQVVSIDVEPQLTNALIYVTQTATPAVYEVSGHNENPLSDNLKKIITTANFDVKDLNLLTADAVPDDCQALIVTTPQRDWTTAEADKARAYLQKGGRAAFFIDLANVDMTNLDAMLAPYGVKFSGTYIVEGDRNAYLQGTPTYLTPQFVSQAITDPLISKKYIPFTPEAQAVLKSDQAKSGLTIEPLLATTASSYAINPRDPQNTQRAAIEKQPWDQSGPFNIGVAVTDPSGGDTPTKLVAFGNSYMLSDQADQMVTGSDFQLALSCVNWLSNVSDSVSITPKYADNAGRMTMSSAVALMISALCVLVVPLIVFAAGLAVWLRRRRS